ncbi:translation initiation factor IF-2-like [Hylaeus volcanicus]|uniref:translation initiation factor IF-2-like n=1 Tax=Hylaeus volcanicus TaxID=313075 RepID=UPI0023B8106F|nr:translation initiation factor IF-2-like [Hylaeus volcanicus]
MWRANAVSWHLADPLLTTWQVWRHGYGAHPQWGALTMNMDNRGLSVYGAEGVGSLSTGAVRSSRPGSPASLSYDWENPGVDHQAPGFSNAPGEETSVAGTSSAAASSGVRVREDVLLAQPVVRLERVEGRELSSGRLLAAADESGTGADSDESDSSVWSARSLQSPLRRKRGRPPTAGDCVGLADAKRKPSEREQRLAMDVADHLVSSVRISRSCKPLKGEEELAAEMRHAPTAELGSRIFESSEAVLRVAKCSNNLHGPMVRQLRIAAATIRHAAVEQAKRVKTSVREVELERTVAELRARVTELEARLARGPVAPAAVPSVPPPVDRAVSVPVPPSRPGASSTARSSRPAASRPAPAGPSRKPAMGGATLSPSVDVEGLIRRLCGEMEVRIAPRPPAGPSQPGPSAVGSRPGTVSGEPAKKEERQEEEREEATGGAAAHPAPALPRLPRLRPGRGLRLRLLRPP